MTSRKLVPTLVPFCLASSMASGAAFDLFIDSRFGSTENTGSSAVLHFEFEDSPSGEDFLILQITNTTDPIPNSSLTAVGFEVPKSLIELGQIEIDFTDGYFDTVTFDERVTPPWLDAPAGYDVMLTGDGDFQGGGGPQGAPRSGDTTTVRLLLGETGFTPADLSDAFWTFYFGRSDPFLIGRYQAVGVFDDSDKVGGGVPEPATLVLFGLAGLAVEMQRRRSRADVS